MKIQTLAIAAVLALSAGVSGAALAHDNDSRGYGWGHHSHFKAHKDYGYRERDHWRKRHWRHEHRDYPRYYRPRHSDDISYGLHLFLSGH